MMLMAESNQKSDEDIVIRTMKEDLGIATGVIKKEVKPIPIPPLPPAQISKEAQVAAPVAPAPVLPKTPTPRVEAQTFAEQIMPPILKVPPKVIPPKEILLAPIKPLYKVAPIWIKISVIGFGVLLLVFLGLYGYWKIFVQTRLPEAPVIVSPATTTTPALPISPAATTTAPIKFWSKLPNKKVTIDLPSKTPTSLMQSLKSEAKVEETRASVKQIVISYQGKPMAAEEFFNLMSIFAPKDFLSNYENEFAFAYFSQKEGARPILILKTKNKELAKNQMADWEKTTFTNDIFPLFLTDFTLPSTPPSFRSYLFINQPVRYSNVNIPYASLNYAIYNDFLIFTTSSAGMFIVLQDLTGQSVSVNYLENLKASINEFVK
ncbi:MAG: hypothetical protein UV48_C0007G0008 [Candidatus Azambacteria bacterium GW2011_GWA2_42_9]|uniref:Uncharacterized protein n=4 Tax=Candidatus Azamiibacteriota TaxID=1752741 RepID=A0A0G0ZBR0_9BACT|nr:MAG: hypothetical protein UV07_C0010G0006 [Candidatus Azambacteria bacterium GW2011_GWB1_42_17]KKS46150.1 MAG: hypothetical protein UV10_C0007G0006 [Candidatus Azambacteria bacterium GW2011_GWA1_42_19]KKS75733.1 MAG: hypothetical protein UV48_C0007G0008 [Candidatus Azambacteria bacterium GW2011_GWA2_42_9]KKS88494.1 MAG: hypothetical protein UV62_C0006G0005 [Parcubacteria group bacterium GW2011_GWC1_43_11]